MRRASVALTGIVLFIALGGGPASASPEDLATSIASEVMSPFCPGVTLENCPSDAAAALRTRIVSWAEDGQTRSQIMDRLVDEYGVTIRALPPAEGSGLWAWLAPGIAVLVGALVAGVLARRWSRRRRDASDSEPVELPGDMRARLDDELRVLRSES